MSASGVQSIVDYVMRTQSSRTLTQLTRWDEDPDPMQSTPDDDVLRVQATEVLFGFFPAKIGTFDPSSEWHLIIAANRVMARLYRRAGLHEGAAPYDEELQQYVQPRTPRKRMRPVVSTDAPPPPLASIGDWQRERIGGEQRTTTGRE